MGLTIAIVDIIFGCVFGLSLLILKGLQELDEREMHGIVVTASNFTVELRNLPKRKNINHLKGELWDWVEKQLLRIKELRKKNFDTEDSDDEDSNKKVDN